MNDLTLQEQALINRIRRGLPFERIEIMLDNKGHLGTDIVVFRAAKERIGTLGQIIAIQVKSKALQTLD